MTTSHTSHTSHPPHPYNHETLQLTPEGREFFAAIGRMGRSTVDTINELVPLADAANKRLPMWTEETDHPYMVVLREMIGAILTPFVTITPREFREVALVSFMRQVAISVAAVEHEMPKFPDHPIHSRREEH